MMAIRAEEAPKGDRWGDRPGVSTKISPRSSRWEGAWSVTYRIIRVLYECVASWLAP